MVEFLLVGGGGNTVAFDNTTSGSQSGGASGGEVLQGTEHIQIGSTSTIVIGASASGSSAFGHTARAVNSATTEGHVGSEFPGANGWNGPSASNGGYSHNDIEGVAGQDGVVWLDGVKYAPGGGGASFTVGGAGGAVGGGQGALFGTSPTSAQNGAPNTGAGAGGVFTYGNGDRYAYGGYGVFKFRYQGSTIRHTGGTHTVSGGYVWVTFTTSGTLTITG